MSAGRHRKLAKFAAGVGLSALFLWLALRDVDLQNLQDALSNFRPERLAGCALLIASGIWLRGLRWRIVGGFPRDAQRKFSQATNLGILGNLVLPVRAGEFVRVMAVARLLGSPLPRPLASAFIDRLSDVIVLVAAMLMLYFLVPVSALLGEWLTKFLGVAALLCVALLWFGWKSQALVELTQILTRRWLRRWPLRPEEFLSELSAEFRHLLGELAGFEFLAVVALLMAVDYLTIGSLLWSFGLALPIAAPLLLWVSFSAGSALPSAPGYIGVYQAAAVWALGIFGASPAEAVAVATGLQLVTLTVSLLVAGWHYRGRAIGERRPKLSA